MLFRSAQTYVFIYLNRSIVKYRNFNFKILIFRPHIPFVHSFLTHSSISNFSEALLSNWLKYWGYNEKLEQHVKEKSHSIFSHGHTKRSLSYILLLYQSYFKLLCREILLLCKMLEIVYTENSEQFYLLQKIDFMNAVSRFEYTVNMMYREQILLM